MTDPAGNQKKYTMDAFGNATSVQETDPNLGTVTTTYGYDLLNHLTTVTMPRGSATQTRTFSYSLGPQSPLVGYSLQYTSNQIGAFLQSATNPENGTVRYTYNANNLLATKTDAKGTQFSYSYDIYNRAASISAGNQLIRTFWYDTPLDQSFSQYTYGRLSGITHTGSPAQFTETFSYTQGGLTAGKRLQLNMPVSTNNGQVIETANFDASYGYNSEGQITSVSYPPVNSYGPAYNYSYDSLARLNGMTNPNDLNQNDGPVVSNAAYGMANELLSFDYGTNYARTYETRGYNSLFQLTSISSGNVSMQYIYPSAGANNGKACLVVDAITGEQTVYAYDSMNRLASAYTYSNSAPNSGCVQGCGNALSWWQGFGYDGFGNLTDKNSSGSPVPSMHIAGVWLSCWTNRHGCAKTYCQSVTEWQEVGCPRW